MWRITLVSHFSGRHALLQWLSLQWNCHVSLQYKCMAVAYIPLKWLSHHTPVAITSMKMSHIAPVYTPVQLHSCHVYMFRTFYQFARFVNCAVQLEDCQFACAFSNLRNFSLMALNVVNSEDRLRMRVRTCRARVGSRTVKVKHHCTQLL